MILYPHFISLILVSVMHCHELFFLLSPDNILPFVDFHPGLKLIMEQGKEQGKEQEEEQIIKELVPL
jgi:hypothetical protein